MWGLLVVLVKNLSQTYNAFMAKSEVHEALERAYSNPKQDLLNPDNHDKVNIALGLLSAEQSDKLSTSIKDLHVGVVGLGSIVSDAMKKQADNIIASNEKLAASNEKYAKANNRLALALIVVTLVVGLLQVYALLHGH